MVPDDACREGWRAHGPGGHFTPIARAPAAGCTGELEGIAASKSPVGARPLQAPGFCAQVHHHAGESTRGSRSGACPALSRAELCSLSIC